MNAIIKIQEREGKQVVSARELHVFLGSKKDFTSWMKQRISRYGFKENEDYVTLTQVGEQNPNTRGGHNKMDYALSVDCAKELSMVEGTAKGREARTYFIECEKKLKEVESHQQEEAQVLPGNIFLEQMKILLGQEVKLGTLEQRQQVLQRQIEDLKNDDSVRFPAGYVSVMGFARIKKLFLDNTAASLMSKIAKKECLKKNLTRYKISDSRWGFVWAYPEQVLEIVFDAYYELLLMFKHS